MVVTQCSCLGARTIKKQPINESDAASNSFCSQTHMQTDAETPGGETEPSAASLLRQKHTGKEYICFLRKSWEGRKMKTQGKNKETEVYALRLVYYCAPEETDSLKPFFIMAHPSHDNRKRNEIGNSVLQLLSYTHLYYCIPHTHSSLTLSHTQSFAGGRFEWSSELPLEFLLWFQFSDALISFSFYCWSQRSCKRQQHTGERAYKHTRWLYCCSLNEILQCVVISLKLKGPLLHHL